MADNLKDKVQLDVLKKIINDPCRVTLFLGSGISVPAPTNMPSWNTFTKSGLDIATQKGLSPEARGYAEKLLSRQDYYGVFDLLKKELAPAVYEGVVVELLPDRKHNENHKLVAESKLACVITTNHDRLLEEAFAATKHKAPLAFGWHDKEQIIQEASVLFRDFFILNLHGTKALPNRVVLRSDQWKEVSSCQNIQNLIRQIARSSHVIFIGYSFRDPDFETIWRDLCTTLSFRFPAVLIVGKGELDAEKQAKLKEQHNITCLEFDNENQEYAFVQGVLTAIREITNICGAVNRDGISKLPIAHEPIADNASAIAAFLFTELSPGKMGSLRVFVRSLILSYFSTNPVAISAKNLKLALSKIIGGFSQLIEDTFVIELKGMQEEKILDTASADLVSPNKKFLESLKLQVNNFDNGLREQIWARLQQIAKEENIKVGKGMANEVYALLVRCLRLMGWSLAQKLLFLKTEQAEPRQAVKMEAEVFCRELKKPDCAKLYSNLVQDILFSPKPEEEGIVFQMMQSCLITSVYILDPENERLLREHVAQHKIYFDASIIIPALAEGHPANSICAHVIRSTSQLGMKVSVSDDILDEVRSHLHSAVKQFEEFESLQSDFDDLLETYVLANGGPDRGNVFVGGLYGQKKLGYQVPWRGYLQNIVGTWRSSATIAELGSYLGKHWHFEVDGLSVAQDDNAELDRLTSVLLGLHSDRPKKQPLYTHEARQFLLIHKRRMASGNGWGKYWFITTDRCMLELQKNELHKYKMPVAHTPQGWLQYLNLLDYDARSSKNFSALYPHAHFGTFSGAVGVTVAKAIFKHHKELAPDIIKTTDIVKELLRDLHVKTAVEEYRAAQYKARSPEEILAVEQKFAKTIVDAAKSYVTIKTKDVDQLKKQLKEQEKAKNKAIFKSEQLSKLLREAREKGKPK